jgi:hypothetical protein
VKEADLTAETLDAYGRNDRDAMQGLMELLKRNGQGELAQRIAGDLKP